jgi:hypothetical protein
MEHSPTESSQTFIGSFLIFLRPRRYLNNLTTKYNSEQINKTGKKANEMRIDIEDK